jgi:hypothetical protein
MMQTYQQKDFEHPLTEQDLEKHRRTVLLRFSEQREDGLVEVLHLRSRYDWTYSQADRPSADREAQ